jgi:hypothetical protein
MFVGYIIVTFRTLFHNLLKLVNIVLKFLICREHRSSGTKRTF